MSTCIEFENVSYAYPLTNKAAIKNVTCSFEEGKCYGIIGPNAAGKTTLCNLMRGLCPKFYKGFLKGAVTIYGKNLDEWDEGELSIRIGYVFQDPFAQISGVKETVFEEIGMGLENLGVEQNEMIKRILSIAKLVNIEHLLQKNPLALSGGQCQRVAFASVLALNSDIIVIDEPTSQLDPEGTNDVFALIHELKKQGKTIIIAEHKVDLMADYCDEMIVMAQGKLIVQGSTREVFSNPILKEHDIQVPQVVKLARYFEEKNNNQLEIPINETEAITFLNALKEI